jgi:hypothetical protein
MKLNLILLVVFLSGCQLLVPVQRKFPEAPAILLEPCAPLQKMSEDKGTLRDMLKVVIENYSTHYQCSAKTESWQEWYIKQKEVFEEVN